MAMASADSVTVSIAALSSGTFRRMLRVSRVETSTCVGSTVECCGTSSTSSKVSAVARSGVGGRQGQRAGLQHPSGPHGRLQAPVLHAAAPWHFLYFFPLPHGHGSLRPTFGSSRLTVLTTSSPPVRAGRGRACLPADAAALDRPPPANAGIGFGRRVVHRDRRRAARRRRAASGASSFEHRPQPEEIADDLFLDAALHVLEEREAFLLVLDERIALAVAAQADAFLQVVERVEVILPLRVDDLQHDVALDAAQELAADQRFLLLVALLRQRPDRVADLVGALARRASSCLELLRLEAEDARRLALERRECPTPRRRAPCPRTARPARRGCSSASASTYPRVSTTSSSVRWTLPSRISRRSV